MNRSASPLTVFYDGACPRCRADRRRYERLAGASGQGVQWLDITGREQELRRAGVDPELALRELHVRDAQGYIHRELDAYSLLMGRVPLLRPLAWIIRLPLVRPLLSRLYRALVLRRLHRSGRI